LKEENMEKGKLIILFQEKLMKENSKMALFLDLENINGETMNHLKVLLKMAK